MTNQSILWRNLIWPGHESCQLSFQKDCWHLIGTAVFSHEQRPCRLDYQIVCDSTWKTMSGKVSGWLGNANIDLDVKVNSSQRWTLNGVEQAEVEGCIDLDLNFSPSTNLLPIRRLNLAIGQQAEVKEAWLRFPSFKLELLSQNYLRLDESRYRYESAGGKFVAELQVNSIGLVTNYPGIWQMETINE